MLAMVCGCAGGRRLPETVPAGESPATSEGPAEATAEPDEVFHVVEPGQTLWRIARAYGVPLDELARVNGIEDATELEVGRMLVVPGATEKLEIAPYPAPLPGSPGATATPTVRLPVGASFVWPLGGEILSYYGDPRRNRRHKGVDIRGKRGQAVVAAGAGRVVYSGDTMRGYGKTVILDHGDGVQSLYAHNHRLLVRVGQFVEQGEQIATVGRTGNATTEHCHFEIRKDRVPVNPLPHLQGGTGGGS
ncbi:MAG: LysM peptidoglycan-binding domain-containing M23 family metallopeptidase [Acidobacteriota bacterium]|nr:LysM peptidoglycan-binding domain-containing M23 family metallopeptidase [Acidobacteriota bacterium]